MVIVLVSVTIFSGFYAFAVKYQRTHDEAEDWCYQLANSVANDKRVQVAMSDNFLSIAECDDVVRPAVEEQNQRAKIDSFFAAARAAANSGKP